MKRDSANDAASSARRPSHLLCAYSPRWLSGPTPGYEGLVPTPWEDDDQNRTGEHVAVPV